MLSTACAGGAARACAFAGRLWLDGRGVPRDTHKGITLLTQACDGGVPLGCSVAARFLEASGESAKTPSDDAAPTLRSRLDLQQGCLLGQPDACFEVGQAFDLGLEGFSHDLTRAAQEYERGCNLADPRACNGYGCALEYGDGVPRDAVRAAALFERACHLGEPTGCANVGFMAEHGEGTAKDLPRARTLYRDSCRAGEFYGCIHAEMLATEGTSGPGEFAPTLARWQHTCESTKSARACEFTSILFLDGAEGAHRDPKESLRAMESACKFGDARACAWTKALSEE